jgi:hypothetical protein
MYVYIKFPLENDYSQMEKKRVVRQNNNGTTMYPMINILNHYNHLLSLNMSPYYITNTTAINDTVVKYTM